MSLLGDLFGYDHNGNDIARSSSDDRHNCPVCGISAYVHSPQQNGECLQKLYMQREQFKLQQEADVKGATACACGKSGQHERGTDCA